MLKFFFTPHPVGNLLSQLFLKSRNFLDNYSDNLITSYFLITNHKCLSFKTFLDNCFIKENLSNILSLIKNIFPIILFLSLNN